MSDQNNMFDADKGRSLLDALIQDSRLFYTSKAYLELLEFVSRMRNFAPFNAMLLQIQKPGLRYAASRADWMMRFGRTIKKDARPLLILWPFAPVALVYDEMDTEGPDRPVHVSAFPANGKMTEAGLMFLLRKLAKVGISVTLIDAGDNKAGSIVRTRVGDPPKGKSAYSMKINQNHNPNTQFATLAHELGHLCLGHLGVDKYLGVPERSGVGLDQREIEAESVAYILCTRNGIVCRSESYLAEYVKDHKTIEQVDHYQVMHAAGAVERLLGLNAQQSTHWQFEAEMAGAPSNMLASGNVDTAQEQMEFGPLPNEDSLIESSAAFAKETEEAEAAIEVLSEDFGEEFVLLIQVVASYRAREVVREILSRKSSPAS